MSLVVAISQVALDRKDHEPGLASHPKHQKEGLSVILI